MITCQIYNESHKAAWNHFVETCKTPLFFFKRDFLEYHSDRFLDSSLMFYDAQVLIALFPASNHGEIINSHGGLTFGGLLLSERIHAVTVSSIIHCLIEKTRELGFKKIIYKSIPYLFYRYAAQEDLYFIVNTLGAKIFRRDLSSVIYLDNRLSLSDGRKRLVLKAKKFELEARDSNDYLNFHQLLTTVLKRHATTPVHSAKEMAHLSSTFPDNIYLKVIEKDSVILAALWLFKFQSTVHTQYIATSDEGKKMCALDYLIETCIEESRENGFKYFSLGISTEQNGKILNSGLIAQKENFGARGVVLDYYEIKLNDQFS